MDKRTIVRRIVGATDITQDQARRAVETFFSCVQEGLLAGETVELRCFGTFRRRWQPPRKGVMPVSGTPYELPQRWRVSFKPGMRFRTAFSRCVAERQGAAGQVDEHLEVDP